MTKRLGISPVIGEFMLIVVAIMIALPMIGFTFGTIGVYTAPAEVTVSTSSCVRDGSSVTLCNFTLANMGAGNTQTVPTVILYISSGNQTRNSVTHDCSGGNTVVSGTSLYLVCHFDVSPGLPGNQYGGSILLANGAQVPFTGRFS